MCANVAGEIDWVHWTDLNGNVDRILKMNHTGDIFWRFKRGPRYNKTHSTFTFIKHRVYLKPNHTVNYWMYTVSINGSWHFVNPKMFTILGDGNLTDVYRPLGTLPSDEYYRQEVLCRL